MQRCGFCSTEKRDLYKCPRCENFYCGTKCYRSEKHNSCSENFYKECVKQQLQGKKYDGMPSDTFEEHMQKYVRGEVDDLPGVEKSKEEDGELLDSDDEFEGDEADHYMEKVLKQTIDDYTLEDDELDRRLLAMGLGSDVEQLINSLTDEERAAFAQLSEQIHQQEEGLGTSCFSRK